MWILHAIIGEIGILDAPSSLVIIATGPSEVHSGSDTSERKTGWVCAVDLSGIMIEFLTVFFTVGHLLAIGDLIGLKKGL